MEILKRYGINLRKEAIAEASVYGLACAYSLIERYIAGYLRTFRLSPAKFNAMMVVKHIGKDKGLSQIQIGKFLIVTASNMTRLLDKLERDGFIERFSRMGDRRVKLIRISRKGSHLLDRIWPGYYKRLKEIVGLLDKEDMQQLSRLMVKWCDKLGAKEC